MLPSEHKGRYWNLERFKDAHFLRTNFRTREVGVLESEEESDSMRTELKWYYSSLYFMELFVWPVMVGSPFDAASSDSLQLTKISSQK